MVKLRSIGYGEDERPVEVTVTLTIEEMAFLHRVTGNMTWPRGVEIMPGGGAVSEEIYSCATNVFNRHWDAGVDGYLRGDDE